MRPNLFMPLGDPDKIESSYPYLYNRPTFKTSNRRVKIVYRIERLHRTK